MLASFAVSYHNDQRLADQTLASKVDLPQPVALQHFNSGAHGNYLGEHRILFEIDTAEARSVKVGENNRRSSLLLVPAYPVSVEADAILQALANGNEPPLEARDFQ